MRAALLVCLLAGVAHADARLDEHGDCPSVRARVAALVGRDPFVDGAQLAIAVTTEATTTGATATLSTSAGGRRTLAAASCASLVDDLALAIAIALASPDVSPDDTIRRDRDDVAITRATDDDDIDSPPTRHGGDVSATLELERPASSELALVGGVATSTSATTAAVFGVRHRSGARSIGVQLAIASADEQVVAPGTIRVSRVDVAIAPCIHIESAAACAVLAGGWLAGTGTGFIQNADATLPYAAAGLRAVWEVPLTAWLALDASAEARVALTTDRFHVDDMAVWTGPRLEAWLGIAAVAHIP